MKLKDNLDNIGALHHIVTCTPVITDIITSLCGKHLGEGCYRSVYEYALDDNYVVKLENGEHDCNIIESLIWNEVRFLKGELEWVKDWFAPVKWISPNGRVLVMRKTTVHNESKKRPDKIPAFLWDVKDSNFGWLGKNYVCHDYGQFYNMISYSKQMKKAKWDE